MPTQERNETTTTVPQALALGALARAGSPLPRSAVNGRVARSLCQAGLVRADADQFLSLTTAGQSTATALGLVCPEARPHLGHEGCRGSAWALHNTSCRLDTCATRTGCVLLRAHSGECFLTRRVVHG